MTQLVIDFGEVVSLPQRETDLFTMAVAAGIPVAEFTARYNECRPAYDRGQSALAFWTEVLGGHPGGQLLAALVERDISSWLHLNPAVLNLITAVRAEGVAVSLLANAPRELARELDRHSALQNLTHRFLSADLQQAKPDPALYETVLAKLGADPADIVVVDDREADLRPAAALGMRTILFTNTPESLDEIRAAVLPAVTPAS